MHPKVICFKLLLITAVFAQSKADFIIITDPLEYTIYNQYQQPVAEQEKSDFVQYSPFQIIEKDMTLGDQITRALKFVFQRKMYYLLKDADGNFSGEKSKTGRRAIQGAESFDDDTIEVLVNGLSMVSGAGMNLAIAGGNRIVRVFRLGPRYYCAALLGRTVYGWSSLEPRSAWRKIESGVSAEIGAINDTVLSESLRQRILARIASANESYRLFFSHFNTLTGDEKAVPQWRCENRDHRLLCRLAGFDFNGDQLSESSKCLAQDIGKMLAGTDFKVTSSKNGEIDIQKRTGSD